MAEATYVGTLIGITSKPGSDWSRIEIAVEGLKYPVKADTKKPEILEAAKAVGTKVSTWTVNEVEADKINPNSGKPYINRYLEGVEEGGEISHAADAGGTAPSTASGSESSDRMTKEEWAAKDSAIHYTACIKAGADALKHTIPSDPTTEDLNKFNERVLHLALAWHNVVIAEREGDDLPF